MVFQMAKVPVICAECGKEFMYENNGRSGKRVNTCSAECKSNRTKRLKRLSYERCKLTKVDRCTATPSVEACTHCPFEDCIKTSLSQSDEEREALVGIWGHNLQRGTSARQNI